MNSSIKSSVIIYHDETEKACMQNVKGHALLFVPTETRIEYQKDLFGNHSLIISPWKCIFGEIKRIRAQFNTGHKFHFTDISGKIWAIRNEAERRIMQKASEFLKQKGRNSIFCKLAIILYTTPTPDLLSGYGGQVRGEKKLRFEETILRILLKGAVHYLYDNWFGNIEYCLFAVRSNIQFVTNAKGPSRSDSPPARTSKHNSG